MRIKAFIKWVLSLRKQEWDLDDYPIRVSQHTPKTGDPNEKEDSPAWRAQVINWWTMIGFGETREEAIQNLGENIASYRRQRGHTPRPGVEVPLEFAPTDGIEKYFDIAYDFMGEILGFDLTGIFVSDGSSLFDFIDRDSSSELFKMIYERYGVDVSDIESGNLVKIFERIERFKTT